MKVIDISKRRQSGYSKMFLENKLSYVDEYLFGQIEQLVNSQNPDTAQVHRRIIEAKERYEDLLREKQYDHIRYSASLGIQKLQRYYKDFFGREWNCDY